MEAQKNGTSPLRIGDIPTAIALLTRLPIKAEFTRGAKASWAYPVAGAAVSAVAGAVVLAGGWVGLGPAVLAGLWITVTVILTGAMHEDGLADCADGFWGGWEVSRRLDIMKDSQIGTYGVLALVLTVGMRWVLAWQLFASGGGFWALLAVEVLSRAFMPVVMYALPHARDAGLSQSQGQPKLPHVLTALGIGGVVSLACVGFATVPLVLLAAAVTYGLIKLANAKIKGQTGDVLGATQQMAALVLLIALAG